MKYDANRNAAPECSYAEALAILSVHWGAAPELAGAALLEGPPGTGKTTLPVSYAREVAMACWVLTTSLLEPADILGLPYREAGEAIADFAPIGPIAQVLSLDDDTPALLVLDDIGHARSDVQAALWPLLAERRVGSRPLPAGVRIVLTANRAQDAGAGARALLSPLLTRATVHLAIRPDQTGVLDYLAGKYAAAPLAAALLDAARECSGESFARANPRQWELACKWLAVADGATLPLAHLIAPLWPLRQSLDLESVISEAQSGALYRALEAALSAEGLDALQRSKAIAGILKAENRTAKKKSALSLTLARRMLPRIEDGEARKTMAGRIARHLGGYAAAELLTAVTPGAQDAAPVESTEESTE